MFIDDQWVQVSDGFYAFRAICDKIQAGYKNALDVGFGGNIFRFAAGYSISTCAHANAQQRYQCQAGKTPLDNACRFCHDAFQNCVRSQRTQKIEADERAHKAKIIRLLSRAAVVIGKRASNQGKSQSECNAEHNAEHRAQLFEGNAFAHFFHTAVLEEYAG